MLKLMNKILDKPRYFIRSVVFILTLGLSFSYFAEYILHMKACQMCLWQRYIALVANIIFTLACVFDLFNTKNFARNILVHIGHVLILFMMLLAYYQVGVENHVFVIPPGCDTQNILATNHDLVRLSIGSIIVSPSCDIPNVIFYLSFATWSAIALTIVWIFTAIYLIKRAQN